MADQCLHASRRSTAAPARVHQHDADHRLSRRRPAERVVSLGAAGRRGGARHRHRPHRAAPAQPAPEGALSLQDADRLDLRQRRSGGAAGRGARGRRLERFRARGGAKPNGAASCAASAALFIEPSGGVGQEEIAIKFDADGMPISLYTLAGPSGQGHETVFPDLVAEHSRLSADKIDAARQRSDGPPLVGTGTLRLALADQPRRQRCAVGAHEIIKKGVDLAAKELEVGASRYRFENGRYRVPGTDLSISLEELVEEARRPDAHPLDTSATIASAAAFPSGAHVAEVEIDPDTGVIDILRYVAVDDCGNDLQPHAGRGATARRPDAGHRPDARRALHLRPRHGQLLTGTFMDYFMPRADSAGALAARPAGAVAGQPARRQGRGRGRHDRRHPDPRQCGDDALAKAG